ncbi:aminotransferase class I/II-fold pyridoxal phosphate-dependent enzyme [Clostridiaceae bacterium 35-E11]
MDDSIILNQLVQHAKQEKISFHVPGHKNGEIYKKYKNQYFSKDTLTKLLTLDVTEIPGTDNLYAPKEMIAEAQKRAARFYKADHSFFLVNGTSAGNISALMTVANPNDKVIVPRDCHKSVMHGLIIGGFIPVYIQPEVSKEMNIPMGIKPETVEQAILENPDAKAVVLTYPNYYGICSDIEAIAKIVHKYEKVLVVDEAHGAHFNLSDRLPISAIEAGADIVSQSTHKTLPAFTQSSMLHVKSKSIDVDRLRQMLMMHQSSSPSYLLMASLDAARTVVEHDGSKWMNQLLKNIDDFYDAISQTEGIGFIYEDIIGKYGVKNLDRTRLVINMASLGISGTALDQILSEKYHIQMEMSDMNHVVAVTTIGNSQKDFNRLLNALQDIRKKERGTDKKITALPIAYAVPKVNIIPRDAAFSKKTEVNFLCSENKISGEYIIPYPPGIPLLCPGEEITAELIEYVNKLKVSGVNIIGMKDNELKRIKVIQK